jgi:hypothetical protein
MNMESNLPSQGHFYLLSDGKRFAQHGCPEDKGLLVFDHWEKAEDFRRTIGAGMPEFKTVQVGPERVFEEFVRHGAMCVAEGKEVTIYRIHKKPGVPEEGTLIDKLPEMMEQFREGLDRRRKGKI